jgi:beta propeller repeat protein
MKALFISLTMVVSMFISTLQADYEVTSFTVCDAIGNQETPDIDGDWIVWQDERDGSQYPHIYGYTMAEPNEVPICTDADAVKKFPAVSGNTVVWEDRRTAQTVSQRDIFAFDLVSRSPLLLTNMPFEDGIYQEEPYISGDWIIYKHKPGSYYNVYAYNKAANTVEAVSAVSTNQYYPAIDGSIVAWMETSPVIEIYYRDINTSDSARTVNLSTSSYAQWHPAISNGVIVWTEDRGGLTGWDIYGFDTNNIAAGTFVICEDSGNQTRPDISGNIVVWEDAGEIYAIDLSEIEPIPFPVSDGSGDNQLPAVSGDVIVWQWGVDGSYDICGARLTKVIPSSLTVTSPVADQMVPAKSQIDIEWQLTGSTEPNFVNIEFSSNSGLNWQPVDLGISFSDLQYTWTPVPDVNEIGSCQIRVSDTSGEVDSGKSGIFSIFQCDADLTADLTGDCFVDFADIAELARQWLICGNPHDESWCLSNKP